MAIYTANTQAVLYKLFGTDWKEAVIKLGRERNLQYFNSRKNPVGVYVSPMRGDHYEQTVEIGIKDYALIRFSIMYYPACCGIRMLYNFSVYEHQGFITQEMVDELLSAFFGENSYPNSALLGRSARLEVIMVEVRELVRPTADMEVEPVDDPKIQYKMLWNFFHKHAKKVRTRLQYNANSGNILHNMEVLF